MSKAVLISIRPKWCEKIASGEKTIEVRKTRPKMDTPFKCYIYRTKGTVPHIINGKWVKMKVGGTVVGEFTCDRIVDAWWDYVPDAITREVTGGNLEALEGASMTDEELFGYVGDSQRGHCYGWHITDLRIYNTPRELSEFWAYNEELHKRYDKGEDFCCYDASDENGEALTDCGEAYNDIRNCYRCWNEWSGWCSRLKRAPQSWCYVEELP